MIMYVEASPHLLNDPSSVHVYDLPQPMPFKGSIIKLTVPMKKFIGSQAFII